jgi:hypothetical protein
MMPEPASPHRMARQRKSYVYNRNRQLSGEQTKGVTGVRKWVWLVLAALLASACSTSAEDLLGRRVNRFIFRGRSYKDSRAHVIVTAPGLIHEALRALASNAEVPIAIEDLPAHAEGAFVPIEIDARDTTVGEILDEIIRQDQRYVYRERLGLIEVQPRDAESDPADCLNMVIPAFRVQDDWNTAFHSLRCITLGMAPHCGGSYPGLPHPPPGIIKAVFHNETARDILDKLCGMVGNMAWEASFSGVRPTCQDMSLAAYQPRAWYPSDTAPVVWAEGLPKNCLGCHYHGRW